MGVSEIYRFSVKASVMFSIRASSEAEATKKAKKFLHDNPDGMDVEILGNDLDYPPDLRAYLATEARPEIQDITTDTTQGSTDDKSR